MVMKRELLDDQQNKIIVANNVTLKKQLFTILFFPGLLALCFSGLYLDETPYGPIFLKDILRFCLIVSPLIFYVSYKMWKDLETKIILTNEKIIRTQPFGKDLHMRWSDIKRVTIGAVIKKNIQDRTRVYLMFTGKKHSSLSSRAETIHCPSAGFFSKGNLLSRDAANLILRNIDMYSIPIKGEKERLEELAEEPDKAKQGTARSMAYGSLSSTVRHRDRRYFGGEHMMGVPEKGLFERQLQVMWIIWGGMLVALVAYVLICLLWGDSLQQSASPFPVDLMRDVLYGIGMLTLILTHFLRKFMLSGRSGGSGPMSSETPSPSDQSAVAGKYVTAMLVSLALSESIGIYGFILFMLGGDLGTVLIFNGIAAMAMFIYRPKREELETLSIAMQTKEVPAP
jgi:hypothetical protein